MESLRKRINFRLVNNAKDYKKYLSKPCFVSQKIFSCFLIKDILDNGINTLAYFHKDTRSQ